MGRILGHKFVSIIVKEEKANEEQFIPILNGKYNTIYVHPLKSYEIRCERCGVKK